MWKFINILILSVLLVSCKDQPDFNLSEHTEKKLVVEGIFTDQVEYQYFTVGWTTNLGDQNPDHIDDMLLEINGPSGLILFYPIGDGRYESAVPFAGIPGANYTINFEYENVSHLATTQMAAPINIEYSYPTPYNEFADITYYPNIHLVTSCTENQYYRYELYKLENDSLPDSNWVQLETPIYWVSKVLDSAFQDVTLYRPDLYNSIFYFNSGETIKIRVYALSNEVGEYLMDLHDFMTSELNGSQYRNPPYYFSNEAYGLVYGTVVDSTYIYF